MLASRTSTALPYSTYSITSNLAYRVGGWDPDWISEDWHMFLKCFLHTSDTPPVRVEGIFLPVMNYTPEDSTYWKSLLARWEQSKRHALGISVLLFHAAGLLREGHAQQKRLLQLGSHLDVLQKLHPSRLQNLGDPH